MEQAQSEEPAPASGEGANAPAPSPPPESTTARPLRANEAGRAGGPVRKLSDGQEREVTRLYAETITPVSEIARTFGIGESSVYRVAKRHGAVLRGRQAAPRTPSTRPAPAGVSGRPEARPSAAKVPEAPPTPVEAATPSTGPRVSGARARRRVGVTRQHRFRIRFLAERVVEARDVRDAVRQAESIRSVEVTAVMRED
jgi:transposase-like protein